MGGRRSLPRRLLTPLAILLAFTAAGILSSRYDRQWDWSEGGRNSLSGTTLALLKRIEDPIRLTVFISSNEALRAPVRTFLERYQRAKPDINVEYVDPARDPARAQAAGIRTASALEVEYRGRKELLARLGERQLTNALSRLALGERSWIAALTGHGERRLHGKANFDLGDFGALLENKGYGLIDLDPGGAIPDNARLLVIASPQSLYLPGEVMAVRRYLARGGNLLWLTEPAGDTGMEALLQDLGLALLPGTVVDASGHLLGIQDPAVAVVARYPPHPISDGFDQITLYPHSAALSATGGKDGWQRIPLLRTRDQSWNETRNLKGEISRDPAQGEQAGPLVIGYAQSRRQNGKTQRVVVVGDGDFLANSFLGNAGNRDLGLRMIRWLTHNDRLIEIPTATAPDRRFQLSRRGGALMAALFMLVLPALFFLIAWRLWRRQRRG